ncbi:MAG: amylo-alpha-1,6-glucosidase [Desulfatibacillaceae bacterium]|nr:amylo-alpha-1,6-glucosidase [Desulfatibacillaceae bacterium]
MTTGPIQKPLPDESLLRFCGDTLTFSLTVPGDRKGAAFLRTNIGQGRTTRREIIDQVEKGITPLARDWFDIPMKQMGANIFKVTVPLWEPGNFEAKAYFLPKGSRTPVWPPGENTKITVKPAQCVCANTLYNAFVRQFGPNKEKDVTKRLENSAAVRELDEAGFTVIPPSGTFRDLAAELDFIISRLGCRFIQLLPIHPTPTTYARMGRFGSPYAALSFTAVDPALAAFDPTATPLEQFCELVDAIHARGAWLLLDMAINHTGWAARLHETHPEWLTRDTGGRIVEPGAWGVVWEDLTKLDYSHKELWQHMAGVLLTWCRRGVDGFRCDAGYMIPLEAWRYITAKVREQYPDTVFFLEGLGGKISVTRALLDKGGFDWAYSELFQNYDRGQIEHYLPQALEISQHQGLTIHFAETHDNLRLAARSTTWARMRTALCALTSVCGGFAFANGVEWLAKEKIVVHQAPSLNWNSPENQVDAISRLTGLLWEHPAFFRAAKTSFIQKGNGNAIAFFRTHREQKKALLVLVNLDDNQQNIVEWPVSKAPFKGDKLFDLLSEQVVCPQVEGSSARLALSPGQVLCLTDDENDLAAVKEQEKSPRPKEPLRVRKQRLAQCALEALVKLSPQAGFDEKPAETAAHALFEDPLAFLVANNPKGDFAPAATWRWPMDAKRQVMVPPDYFLLVTSPAPFTASIMEKGKSLGAKRSMEDLSGSHFALFAPIAAPNGHQGRTLKIAVHEGNRTAHASAPVLYLAQADSVSMTRTLGRQKIIASKAQLLGTNAKGAMMRVPVQWGCLYSRYDALLAANPDADTPVDRRIMLARCRGWVVFQGHSHELGSHCQDAFCFNYHSQGFWRFTVPTGQGEHIVLLVRAHMEHGKNAVRLSFFRESAALANNLLADNRPVRLIIRPDVEDRNFHLVTKAFMGPEELFPASVESRKTGFCFSPYRDYSLEMDINPGGFAQAQEWQYMVHRQNEGQRGEDPNSDLFSPGYFSAELKGGSSCEIFARAVEKGEPRQENQPAKMPSALSFPRLKALALPDALEQAMEHFVVSRGSEKSIIAGYPWFLDWGRDSLIFTRGLIAAGRRENALSVLKLFGSLEERGTLPNMIQGKNAANRDTTDAPLWFFVCCADLAAQEGMGVLKEPCGGRTLFQILVSIASHYQNGTGNGVRMDPNSGLIFSPAHFTWMDTDFPAGTPREGYPVEIQALWIAALKFMEKADPKGQHGPWAELAKKAEKSFSNLFFDKERGYLADCLHADSQTPAAKAAPDDHLRPNQLFAITLGALEDAQIARAIINACQSLLVPGAIRSLADRPVNYQLPVRHNNVLLNNPHAPYWGTYQGDENTRRKPAYHNGTAWAWPFPSFCEAYAMTFGRPAQKAALAWLSSCANLLEEGSLGQIPEILDGDFPHTQRGCDAQAWSASEFYRVFKKLSD